MIDKDKIGINWLEKVSKENRKADKILIEKVIHALLLLEGLVRNNIPFVFKGGTSLMLHFESAKRLSIDIDIIIEERIEDLENLLNNVAKQQGFTRVEEHVRAVKSDIEKAHYKFYYIPTHKTAQDEEYILLDILFENISYKNLVDLQIASKFVPQNDEPLIVKAPSLEDLLGDKLTAFAPNTTGIPYIKNDNSMSMEIIKQLYDIGNLFDECTNIDIINHTFYRFARTELLYRELNDKDVNDVLQDIFQTSLCLSSKGVLGVGNFNELQTGIKRITGFIFSEAFHIEKAIVAASKAGYIVKILMKEGKSIEKFKSAIQIKDWSITNPDYNKLNKLKKSNPEAFFYWYKTIELIS